MHYETIKIYEKAFREFSDTVFSWTATLTRKNPNIPKSYMATYLVFSNFVCSSLISITLDVSRPGSSDGEASVCEDIEVTISIGS